jgi:UDP-glucose 4-epimerase
VLAARGEKDAFTITGVDHPTRDGTGIRDYIHVWDLARAHVRAVERFDRVLGEVGSPSAVINVGRGEGVTVRELVAAFERVFGSPVPVVEAGPRPGDVVGAYAGVHRAARLLDWQAELGIDDAIASALAWAEKRHQVLGYA